MHAKKDPDDGRRFTIIDAERRELECECHDVEEAATWMQKVEAAALAAAIARTRAKEEEYFAKADIDGSGSSSLAQVCVPSFAADLGRDVCSLG